MVHTTRKRSAAAIVLLAGAALGTLMLFLMQGMTTFTYDDYYYAVFLRDGLSGFVEQNVTHYLVRNGRVLVHAAAELLLGAGRWVYSLGNLLILGGVLVLGLRYLRPEDAPGLDRPLAAGTAAGLVLAGSYRVFRSWLLCPADSANYMLPLLAIFGMLLALRRRRNIPALVLSVLCGATTELCAVAGFAVVALELLDVRLRQGRWDRLRLGSLGCILCGLGTILLSPATQSRVGSELSLQGIGFSFLRYANSIAAPGTSLLLLTVVTILMGLSGKSLIHRLAIPTALMLAAGWILPRSTRFTAAAFAVFCVYVLLWAAAVILDGTQRCCGFALLAGLGTAAFMTLSNSGSIRVTIPFVLIIVLCGVHLLLGLADRSGKSLCLARTAVAFFLWIALLAQLPTLQGIARNWQIMRQNESTMTRQHMVYTDYDPRYCSQQLFMSPDFQRVYLKYLKLEGAAVEYTYAYGPAVSIGGEKHPSVRYRDRTYLPLRAAVEAAGGSVQLISDSFLEIRLGDRCFLYQGPELHTPDGKLDAAWEFISVNSQFYVSTDLLQSALGIETSLWED